MLSLASIHQDWQGRPGASLSSDVVRALVIENPRIVRRLIGKVARDFHLVDDQAEMVPEADRRAFGLLVSNVADFVVGLGLVFYGNYLATFVDRGGVLPLVDRFALDDLRRAVRLRRYSPLGSDTNFERARFSEIVRSMGEQCVVAWAAELPAGHRQQVMLLFPRKLMHDQDAIRQRIPPAADIVRAFADDVLAVREHGGAVTWPDIS